MKLTRQFVCLLLVGLLFLGMVPAALLTAEATSNDNLTTQETVTSLESVSGEVIGTSAGTEGLVYKFYASVNGRPNCGYVTGYVGTDPHVEIPTQYNGYTIIKIDSSAFASNTLIESVIIPDSVEEIGTRAFNKCTSLKNVSIPDSVTNMSGGYIFDGCSSLESIVIPNSVTTLGYSIFHRCINLSTVTLGNQTIEIPSQAFYGCSKLQSITIPSTVTEIGINAFSGCTSLDRILIPKSVSNIGASAFVSCSNLTIYCEANSQPAGWDSTWNYSNCPVIFGQEVEAITISMLPTKTRYVLDVESLDLSGSEITVTYTSGEIEKKCLTEDMVSGFTNRSLGNQTLTVAYGSKTATFCIEVYADIPKLSCISVKLPYKMAYKEGDQFDPSGMVVTAFYTDGSSNELQDYEISGFTGVIGTNYISVSYKNMVATFTVSVTPFSGSGTESDPYQIENEDQLKQVCNYDRSCFALMNDISLSYSGWTPISGSVSFYGIFDGNGFSIKNLHTSSYSDKAKVGLFASNHGIIKNLGVDSCNFILSSYSDDYIYIGAIVGENYGVITNCYATGSIDAVSDVYIYAGGIAGANRGTITNCYSEVEVFASYNTNSSDRYAFYYPHAGGITGYNNGGKITNCYNSGNIQAAASGYNAWVYAGGLVGDNDGALSTSYNVGKVSTELTGTECREYSGGVAGRTRDVISGCYYLDNNEKGVGSGSDFTVRCSAIDMMSEETFVDFDFESTWTLDCCSDYTYPKLIGVNTLKHTEEFVPAVEPTCTESGLTGGWNCGVCGETLVDQENIIALGHDMSQWQTATSPTCTEDGSETRSCTRCDHTEIRTIDATGHRYSAIATAPTCTEKGYTTHTCANCSDSYTDTFVDALGHVLGNWVTDIEPTCTESGKQCRVCLRCTYSEERVIDATGHSYAATVTDPTCTEQGYTIYTCTCGDSYKDEYVDVLGHDMGDWKMITAPTCTENGSESCTCTRCDYVETRAIDATGHSHTAIVTDPTCTEQGFTTYTCSCGDTYISDEVPALGHTKEIISAVAATCIETGLTEGKKCSVCSEILVAQEVVPALGHDWKGTSCLRCDATRENPFDDVAEGSFYMDPVLWAVENGITNGATPTTFNPNGICLRAHVVTFLHRAAKSPEPSSTKNPFTDVKSSDFFYKPVLWAVEKGITNGTSATTFGSYANCNRAAVVTFLWRAAGSPEPESTDNPFVDVKATDFFYKPVLWAVEKGITNGVDATHFGPTADCNRAQVVTFLYRAYNYALV